MIPTCNICGSNKNTVVYDSRKKLYNCINCDHTFVLIDEKYNTESIYVEDYFDSAHRNWFKYPNYSLFRYIHRAIVENIKRPDFKLLDIGSGRGDLLKFIRKVGPNADLTGIDVTPCASSDFKFIQDDFMTIEIKDKYDVITSLACIEHLKNPALFVKKLRGMVSPEGLVVIMTQNSGGLMYVISKFFNRIGIHSGYDRLYSEHHIHHFTNRSLRLLLEKQGFRIVSHKNHNHSLLSVDYPPAGFVTTLLYKFLTAGVFFVSSISNSGFLQTVVCVPQKNNP